MRKVAHVFAGIVFLSIPNAGFARPEPALPQKAPWQWTDDERIAARLDPAGIQERAAAYAVGKHEPGIAAQSTAEASQRFVIDGSRNPELFLPHELFSWLMGAITADDPKTRETWRLGFASRLRALDLNEDQFWNELQQVTSTYTDAEHERKRLAVETDRTSDPGKRRSMQQRLDGFGPTLCRSRYDALMAARAHFGRETFDRILYVAAAPGLITASPTAPSAGEASGLRFISGGCK